MINEAFLPNMFNLNITKVSEVTLVNTTARGTSKITQKNNHISCKHLTEREKNG